MGSFFTYDKVIVLMVLAALVLSVVGFFVELKILYEIQVREYRAVLLTKALRKVESISMTVVFSFCAIQVVQGPVWAYAGVVLLALVTLVMHPQYFKMRCYRQILLRTVCPGLMLVTCVCTAIADNLKFESTVYWMCALTGWTMYYIARVREEQDNVRLQD